MIEINYKETEENMQRLIEYYRIEYSSVKNKYIKAVNDGDNTEKIKRKYRKIETTLSFIMEFYIMILKEKVKIVNDFTAELQDLSNKQKEVNKRKLKPKETN